MSNTVILWSMLILPWLTLFFLKKEELKRYMPVALFATVTTAMVVESGITLKLWSIRETVYPLNQMPAYVYGVVPVVTMWIFKYTYGRFWRYWVVNAIFDVIFSYVFLAWLVSRGIFEYVNSFFVLWTTSLPHGISLYLYQMWQEDALVPAVKEFFLLKPQPAATKPFIKDKDKEDKPDNR